MPDFSANEPHLSELEQISPQAYVRFILCFGIRSGVSLDDATQVLRQGSRATASNVHVLNSLVVSVTDSNGNQAKDLRPDDLSTFTVKDLTNTRLAHGDIRSHSFPSHIFDGKTLCPTGVFAVPGSPVPVFLVQANLITGVILLGFSVWHGALDGTAITTLLKLWAQNCCTIQDSSQQSFDNSILSSGAFDEMRLSKVSCAEGGTIDHRPEFLLLPEAPTALPPALTQTLKAQIFHISPDSISALKELASPENSASP